MRLLLQVVKGKAPPVDPRTKQPVRLEPHWYPHIPYWLRRVRDGSMEAVDPAKMRGTDAVLDGAETGPQFTAEADPPIKAGKKSKARRKARK